MSDEVTKRKRLRLALVFALLLLLGGWYVLRLYVHPEFGRYYTTSMSESYQSSLANMTRLEKLERSLRERLKLPLPQPQSQNGYDWGLKLGPAELGWGIAMNAPPTPDGYIIMRNVNPSGHNAPLWEIALSSKRRLQDMTRADLHCEYYGMDDPRGAQVFGKAWQGAAVRVPEGQIFLARLITNRSTVYLVRLAKQGGDRDWGTMEAEYLVATNAPD